MADNSFPSSTLMHIPLNDLQRCVGAHVDAIKNAIDQVLASGRYVLGNAVASFEREFADYCGVAHCVGVGNGSDALELALRALGVAANDEVVTVANAAMYSTLAIRAIGATPVYADVDDATLTMNVASLRGVLTQETRAIIVTHLYGRLADIGAIKALAVSAGLPLIEDCAQAHGAGLEGQRAGGFGNIGCFSFYPTKNLGAVGDGGAVTTDDAGLAARVRALRQYGWQQKYVVAVAGGRNSRLDELQAAVLRVKLRHLDVMNIRRRAIAQSYSNRIRNTRIRTPAIEGENHVAHLYIVRTAERESLRSHLAQHGVGTDIHYPLPDHRQPTVTGTKSATSLPTTEQACREVLTLPCFPEMTDAEADYVITACNTWTP